MATTSPLPLQPQAVSGNPGDTAHAATAVKSEVVIKGAEQLQKRFLLLDFFLFVCLRC